MRDGRQQALNRSPTVPMQIAGDRTSGGTNGLERARVEQVARGTRSRRCSSWTTVSTSRPIGDDAQTRVPAAVRPTAASVEALRPPAAAALPVRPGGPAAEKVAAPPDRGSRPPP